MTDEERNSRKMFAARIPAQLIERIKTTSIRTGIRVERLVADALDTGLHAYEPRSRHSRRETLNS